MLGRSRLRLAIAISLLLVLSRSTFAQAPPETTPTPTDPQLEELKREIQSQRAAIEKLEAEAKRNEETLRQMQEKADAQAKEAKSAAKAAKPQPLTVFGFNPPPAQEGAPSAILRISDSVAFRFGAEVQLNYEALQDVNSGGYSQNFYIRRGRFLMLGALPHGVTLFLQTDGGAMLGYAGQNGVKNVNSGFRFIDALAHWAFAGKTMALEAGLFLVPSVRQRLTKNWEFMSLDLATWVFQEQTPLTENANRDYGVGLDGVILNDRLSYRFDVLDGHRYPAGAPEPPHGAPAGSRNSPRIAGRLMYDFFEPEYAYAYNGTFLRPNKVASLAFVGDGQGYYKAFGGDAFFQWPVGSGSVTFEADYLHYDAHHFVYNIGGTPTPLPEQQTFFTNAGYCFLGYKLQPWVRFETLTYAEPVNLAKEQSRVGGGVNYYVLGFNFKLTAAYERILNKVQPPTAAIKNQNRFVFQVQGWY